MTISLSHRNVFSRSDLPEEEECDGALTVLVLDCSATRSIFAHAVPKIDSQGYIVEMIRDDVPGLDTREATTSPPCYRSFIRRWQC